MSHGATVFEEECFHTVRGRGKTHIPLLQKLFDKATVFTCRDRRVQPSRGKNVKHRASIDPVMLQEEVVVLIWFNLIAQMIKNSEGAIKTSEETKKLSNSINGIKDSPTRTFKALMHK